MAKSIFSLKASLIALVALGLASCSAVYDNRDNCVNGIQLRFVYDYHMEPGANAFAANVDCIVVYVFDNEGNYLRQFTETSEQLMEDHYRMVLPLEEGDYRLMVYGGLSCNNPTFEISKPWDDASRAAHHDDIIVSLPHTNGVSANKLHDIETRQGGLFYGFQYRRSGEKAWINSSLNESHLMEVSVTSDDFGSTFTEYDVNLMKDTNNIVVILQELSGPFTVDYRDYDFTITDDNFRLDAQNLPNDWEDQNNIPVYKPHTMENRIMGYADNDRRDGSLLEHDDSTPVQVGLVEFSTSRLHIKNFEKAQLVVKSTKESASEDGREIIRVPLINYLAATRGFGSGWIKSDQEYLDRQSNWSLYFFLQEGRWVQATVAVNDWIVRIDNIELGM